MTCCKLTLLFFGYLFPCFIRPYRIFLEFVTRVTVVIKMCLGILNTSSEYVHALGFVSKSRIGHSLNGFLLCPFKLKKVVAEPPNKQPICSLATQGPLLQGLLQGYVQIWRYGCFRNTHRSLYTAVRTSDHSTSDRNERKTMESETTSSRLDSLLKLPLTSFPELFLKCRGSEFAQVVSNATESISPCGKHVMG